MESLECSHAIITGQNRTYAYTERNIHSEVITEVPFMYELTVIEYDDEWLCVWISELHRTAYILRGYSEVFG